MAQNKRLSYTVCYKLQVIVYAEEHGNRAAEGILVLRQVKKW
jgi:hypothetical protein